MGQGKGEGERLVKSLHAVFDNTCLVCYVLAMKVECDGKTLEYDKPMAIYKLMEHLLLNKETYLAMVNNRLVTEDYRAGKDDAVKFIKVVSGG